MRVKRITLDGFGPFHRATFEIPPPNSPHGELILFEGPNGSGKTTISEALAAVAGTEALVPMVVDGIAAKPGEADDIRGTS